MSASIAGFLSIITSFLITGGLHEDGLADVADGFGGGWSRERKLEIMHDSSIGTYGTFALIASVAIRALGYGEILTDQANIVQSVLIFAGIGCLSRTPLIYMMYKLKPARLDGRAVEAGKPSRNMMRQAVFSAVIITTLFIMFSRGFSPAVLTIFSAVAAYVLIKYICLKQIGGYTGDVLGSLQQITEIFAILLLIAIV